MSQQTNHEHHELTDHEIKLRVLQERFDDIESLILTIDNKINRIISGVIFSILLPIILHFYHLV